MLKRKINKFGNSSS